MGEMTYEEAGEVSSSSVWTNICKELDLWIENELQTLKNCGVDRVPFIQQTIRDYEKVKNLPTIVKDRLE